MQELDWRIELDGRSWTPAEAAQRHGRLTVPIEMIGGKLLHSEAGRLALLAALLENVGAQRAVEIGDPNVWREAVGRLEQR